MADGTVRPRAEPAGEGQHGLRPAPPPDRRRGHARRSSPPRACASSPSPARPRPPGWPSPRPPRRSTLLHGLRAALGGAISAFELIDVQGLALPRRDPAARAAAPGDAAPTGACWSRPPTPPAPSSAPASRRRSPRRSTTAPSPDALIAQSAAQRDVLLDASANRSPRPIAASARSPATTSRCRRRASPNSSPSAAPAIAALDPERPDQLLRPPRRRQPALQRLSAARAAPAAPTKRCASRFAATVHDLVHALGGSVGAEHGVGRLKTGDLVRYGDPGKAEGDARDQGGARSGGDPQPRRGRCLSLGRPERLRPFSRGGGEKGRAIQTGGSEDLQAAVRLDTLFLAANGYQKFNGFTKIHL